MLTKKLFKKWCHQPHLHHANKPLVEHNQGRIYLKSGHVQWFWQYWWDGCSGIQTIASFIFPYFILIRQLKTEKYAERLGKEKHQLSIGIGNWSCELCVEDYCLYLCVPIWGLPTVGWTPDKTSEWALHGCDLLMISRHVCWTSDIGASIMPNGYLILELKVCQVMIGSKFYV